MNNMPDEDSSDGAPNSAAYSDAPKKERDREQHRLKELFNMNMPDSKKEVCHEKAAVLLLSWELHCDELKVQKEVGC